jgi:large subunit ribosomal protein L2
MPIKLYKPTTSSRRKASVVFSPSISRKRPERRLIETRKKKTGRSRGKITCRHKGGGARRYWRKIDFKQDKFDIPAKIVSLEYDPNRSAWIALVCYKDGEKRYILATDGLKVGDEVISSKSKIEIKTGNRMPLKYIPTGMLVSNIELFPGQGGKIVRSAGSSAHVLACEGGYVHLKMPSGEVRKILEMSLATLGQISKPEHRMVRLGKAGRSRHKGRRPSVRGKAMNAVDHPHGGGEGHSPIGLLRGPRTPWGKHALGPKTRKKKKWSNKFIIKRRIKRRR